MEHSKCKICGERHALGGCPSFETSSPRARSQAVKASAFDADTGGSNPPAPASPSLAKEGTDATSNGTENKPRAGVSRGSARGRKADDKPLPGKKRDTSAKPTRANPAANKANAGRRGKPKPAKVAKKGPGRAQAAKARNQAAPKVGRPRAGEREHTLTATQPWKAAGISKATWYRQKKPKDDK